MMKRIIKKLANVEYVYEKRDDGRQEYIEIKDIRNDLVCGESVLTRQEALALFRFMGKQLNIGCNECRRYGALNKKEQGKITKEGLVGYNAKKRDFSKGEQNG